MLLHLGVCGLVVGVPAVYRGVRVSVTSRVDPRVHGLLCGVARAYGVSVSDLVARFIREGLVGEGVLDG